MNYTTSIWDKVFRRGALVLAAAVISVAVAAEVGAQDLQGVGGFRTGARKADQARIQAVPSATVSLGPADTLPPSFDLSGDFPKPHQTGQGNQGSCVAWAIAYGVKTFHERVDQNWDHSVPAHQFSPAYIYNQLNGGVDEGLYVTDALRLVQNRGAATLVTSPYNPADFLTWPTAAADAEAAKYPIATFRRVDKTKLRELKTVLKQGTPIIFAVGVDDLFGRLRRDEVWNGPSGQTGGHAMVVIGYDDTKVNPGQTSAGAFKILNSWGTSWATDGYGWISYEAFVRVDEAYITVDKRQRH